MTDERVGSQMQQPISKNTPITIGLVILVLSASAGAIFKAGQVLTEFDYVKAGLVDIRADVSSIKSTIQRMDRNQRGEGEHPTKNADAK